MDSTLRQKRRYRARVPSRREDVGLSAGPSFLGLQGRQRARPTLRPEAARKRAAPGERGSWVELTGQAGLPRGAVKLPQKLLRHWGESMKWPRGLLALHLG